MSGIGAINASAAQLQNSHPGGDEHAGFITSTNLSVSLLDNFTGAMASGSQIVQQGFAGHHEKRSRNTFAGDICDQ